MTADADRLQFAWRRRVTRTRRFFSFLAGLERRGIRIPKPLVHVFGRLDKAYERIVVWRRLAGHSSFAGVREVRRHAERLNGLRRLDTVLEATTITFSKTQDRDYLHYVFGHGRNRQRFSSAFLCQIDRPFLHVAKGAVATCDRMLVAESVRSKVQRFVATVPLPAAVPARAGTAATIQANMPWNYYHWIIDCLPRTYLLAQARVTGPVALLVPEPLAPFQRVSLQCCLPEHVQIVPVAEPWVQVERLLLPSFVSEPSTGYLPTDCLRYLRSRIFDHLGIHASRAPTRRLYVSRAGTAHRRIINEPAIIESLLQLGFEVCHPEELPFEEQVRLFQSAAVIVGARGAGLTNILFSDRVKVLELTSLAPFAGSFYFSLAHALGQEHFHLFAQRTAGMDFEFSPSAVVHKLREMGVTR